MSTLYVENMDLHKRICEALSQPEMLAFQTLSQACADQGLLARPISLKEEDCSYGLNDEVTLLLAPIANI